MRFEVKYFDLKPHRERRRASAGHVKLQGASQLKVNCTAASADGSYGEDIDVVLGDARLSP